MSEQLETPRYISLATACWLVACVGLFSAGVFYFVQTGDLTNRLATKEAEVRELSGRLVKGMESVADAVQRTRVKDQAQIQELSDKLQKAQADTLAAVERARAGDQAQIQELSEKLQKIQSEASGAVEKARADEKAACDQSLTERVRGKEEALGVAQVRAKAAADLAAQEKGKWEKQQADHQQWLQDIKLLRQERQEFTQQQDQLRLAAERVNEREKLLLDYSAISRKNESGAGVMLGAVYMAYLGANRWKNDKDKFCSALRSVTGLGEYHSANDLDTIEPFRRQFVADMNAQLGKRAPACTDKP